jgi:hypothetical protein
MDAGDLSWHAGFCRCGHCRRGASNDQQDQRALDMFEAGSHGYCLLYKGE